MTYDLDGLRAAVEKATPGEWRADYDLERLSILLTNAADRLVMKSSWHSASKRFPTKDETLSNAAAIVALLNAARAGLLDDADKGRMVPALVDMLKECARQFRFYAEQHKAKGTPEADEKARVNGDFAARIAMLLRSQLARDEALQRHVDDAALGRAVRAAAEGKNPNLLFALVQGYQSVPSLDGYEAKAQAAARALVAMGGKDGR